MVCEVAFVPLLTVHMNGAVPECQPHECELSEVAVKEQASLVVQKKTTEIGRKEIRGQNVKVRPISGWR